MSTLFPSSSYPLTLSQSRPLRYAVFFYLYAMQGIPAGFALTALTNYLTAQGVRSSQIGQFAAVVGLPWAFQFVWGPLIDRYQMSVMGRRKPWVVGAQCMAFLASLGVLFVKNPVAQVSTLAWFFFAHSVFAAIQDASVDAMAISIIPDTERGRVNAFMRSGFIIGIGVGAAVFSQILHTHGFFRAALTQSLCLLALTVLTFFIRERPENRLLPSFAVNSAAAGQLVPLAVTESMNHERPDFRWLFSELFKGLLAKRSLLLLSAVVTAYLSVSLFVRSYNYHLIKKLGWADTSVSLLTGTYGMLVATGIALLGGYLADRVGPRRLLMVAVVLVSAYLLGFNALSSFWVQREVAQAGLVSLYFMDPSLSATAMPVLMAICRPGVEGSQFTTYMAFVNLSDIAGSFLAGQALTYFTAPAVGLFAGGLAALAGIVLWFTLRYYRASPSVNGNAT